MFHKILWFSFFALCVGITAFMYVNPGMVYIHWTPYVIEVSTLVFALLFLGALFFTFLFATGIQKISSFISSWRENKKLLQFQRVEALFLEGFTALESEDETIAKESYNTFLSHQAKMSSPLGVLYRFLYERKMNIPLAGRGAFLDLQGHPKLSVLAYKMQIEQALLHKNYSLAETLLKDFLYHHHESPWFLKAAVMASLHTGKFAEALNYAEKKKSSTLAPSRQKLTGFIWLKRAEEEGVDHPDYLSHLEKAYEDYPTSKVALLMGEAYIKGGNDKNAKKILLDSWEKEPTFEVGSRYANLGDTAYEQAELAKQLFKKQPDSLVAGALLTLFYLRAELWGEARSALERLKKKGASDVLIAYFESVFAYDEGKDAKTAYTLLRNSFEEEIGNKTTLEEKRGGKDDSGLCFESSCPQGGSCGCVSAHSF